MTASGVAGDIHPAARTLEGKSALVTGASGGIGRRIACALAEAGASVGLLSRTAGRLAETARLTSAYGVKTAWSCCDVTDPEQVRRAVDEIRQQIGSVDILVNNAGGARFSAPLLDVEPRGWGTVIDLNLTAPYIVARAVVPGMMEAGGGAIVNIGSFVGTRAQQSLAPYASAKAGLVMLTRSMAREWGPHAIRANVVIPGVVATAAWERYRDDPDLDDLVGVQIPLGRWADPGEIAAPVVFLASEAASYVTGAALVVDGGAGA